MEDALMISMHIIYRTPSWKDWIALNRCAFLIAN